VGGFILGTIGYMFSRMKHINFDRFKKHIDVIKKNTGKSKLYITFDFFINFIIYGCSYTDYFRGDYINLTKEQKKTFVNAKSFYKILKYFNKDEDKIYLSDKIVFNNTFKEYLKRDYIDLRHVSFEEFTNFLSNKDVVFAKVIDGFGGHGISKIVLKDFEDKQYLFDELLSHKQYLVEEALIQSKELNEINPNSISSFRVVTLYKDGKSYLLNNALRVNQNDAEVIGCTDDLYFKLGENGKIVSNVIDDYGNIYEKHPLTNKVFKDVCIPDVKEAFKICLDAALKLPNLRYIGWDVGFTSKGPCLIEGNEFPGYGIIQHFALNGSKTGHFKEIKDVCIDEKIL